MNDEGNFQIPVLIPHVPQPTLWTHLLEKSFAASRFSNGGPLAKVAEQKISNYLGGVCEVMVCASNTSGLVAALIAFGCRGNKVLVSNYTFAATLNAVHCAGAVPVLCDVDLETWEISVEQIMKAQLEFSGIHTVLITRVHGFIRDFSAILDYCASEGIKVVIDAAAAYPGDEYEYKVRKEVAEVFSFHATKPLGIGEGGAVVGDTSTIAAVRSASNFGLEESNEKFGDGLNAKMDEFAAARLIAAIENFKVYVEARRIFADKLRTIFSKSDSIVLPNYTRGTSWPFFPVKFRSPNDLHKFQNGLVSVAQTRRYYFPSMSDGYVGQGEILRTSNLGVSVDLAETSLCLPVIPSLDEDNQARYFNKVSELIKLFPKT